jgi:hypothetical protein
LLCEHSPDAYGEIKMRVGNKKSAATSPIPAERWEEYVRAQFAPPHPPAPDPPPDHRALGFIVGRSSWPRAGAQGSLSLSAATDRATPPLETRSSRPLGRIAGIERTRPLPAQTQLLALKRLSWFPILTGLGGLRCRPFPGLTLVQQRALMGSRLRSSRVLVSRLGPGNLPAVCWRSHWLACFVCVM